MQSFQKIGNGGREFLSKTLKEAVAYYAIFTFLLNAWSKVLLGKLTGFELVKKFPAFYGIRKFITAFTSARHLSLSCFVLVVYLLLLLLLLLLAQNCAVDRMEKNEMGWACGAYGLGEGGV